MKTLTLMHCAFEIAAVEVAQMVSEKDDRAALEDLFAGTQNVHASWVEERGQMGRDVAPLEAALAAGGCRSTSVDDCVVVQDGTATRYWVCQSFGWKQVSAEIFETHIARRTRHYRELLADRVERQARRDRSAGRN